MSSDVTGKRNASGSRPARWTMVVGCVTGLATLVFFMGLLVADSLGLTGDFNSFLVIIVLALGLALSFSFIGGTAGAEGKLPLSIANKYPISFSVGGGVAVFVVVLLVGQAIMPRASPIQPVDFDLRFTADQQLPIALSFIQYRPEYERYRVARQDDFFERENIRLPPYGQEYYAEFMPAVEDSSRTYSLPEKYEICFTLKNSGSIPAVDAAYAMLSCPADKKCIVDQAKDPGWIQDCDDEFSVRWLDGLVGIAFAQSLSIGWTVPSLETLRLLSSDPAKRGPGYTDFRITTGSLPEVSEADAMIYSVRVNGTQLFVDGWRPDKLRIPFDGRQGLEFEFGVQNLSFSGQHRGLEEIEVTIDFLAEGHRIGPPLTLSRRYAACTTDGKEVSDPGPVEVSWEPREDVDPRWLARYIPPHVEDRFEIIVRSSTDASELERTKRQIDDARQRFNEKTVVGVLRPPLDGNPHFAVMIGLEKPNGQTQFTFSEELANEVCRWTYENRSAFERAVREDVFRMENDLEHDHPQRRIQCRML